MSAQPPRPPEMPGPVRQVSPPPQEIEEDAVPVRTMRLSAASLPRLLERLRHLHERAQEARFKETQSSTSPPSQNDRRTPDE
jgi:hypothetical protein